MIKPRQSALPHTPTLWARLMALAGLLLVLVASTGQAAHVHGDWLPHHGTELRAQTESSITGDDGVNCPLCVAMHSAIAVVLAQQLAPPARRRGALRWPCRPRGFPLPALLAFRPPPAPARLKQPSREFTRRANLARKLHRLREMPLTVRHLHTANGVPFAGSAPHPGAARR